MSTILVVEDSPTQREIISDILKGTGLTVAVANDGVEAMERIQLSCPDIVVMDIVMPKMNGYELCRRLKTNPETKNVMVVMCSTKGEEFDRYWGMKQGADAYIVKPFQPKEFLGTVRKLLQSSHRL
ncbi:MAG: response regulator [Chroococcidiopsidaceae cyanobacterium CP_BM_RX_35]|nr:response regulator [Chroococcidiopsidaceae cyanobacterium CP_BM_RX_35]